MVSVVQIGSYNLNHEKGRKINKLCKKQVFCSNFHPNMIGVLFTPSFLFFSGLVEHSCPDNGFSDDVRITVGGWSPIFQVSFPIFVTLSWYSY